jgi:23S rRNA (guanosine2251-2'-O)-methyltransferase
MSCRHNCHWVSVYGSMRMKQPHHSDCVTSPMRKLKVTELGRMNADEFREAEKIPVAVLLDNVRSLHNVGAVFRSADAFCVQKLWLCGYTPCPPHRDIRKTALGAEETVTWEHRTEATELIQQLKAEGWRIVAIEQTDESIPLDSFFRKEGEKYLFVFGNEADGVQESIIGQCDVAVEIPQKGTKHSLNISVAAGIVLYEVTQ